MGEVDLAAETFLIGLALSDDKFPLAPRLPEVALADAPDPQATDVPGLRIGTGYGRWI